MPINVKAVRVNNRIALEIVGGYRSGQFIGSEDGIFAQYWNTTEEAFAWAIETGYTIARTGDILREICKQKGWTIPENIDVSLIEPSDLYGIPLPNAEGNLELAKPIVLTKEERATKQINKHSHNYPKGMTVKELKALIADWPEVNQDGEDTVVLISTEDGIDCSVHSSWCSSARYNDKGELVYDLSLDVGNRV